MTIHHRNDGSLVLENKRADHGGHIFCTAISPHCELVATGGSERVAVWEADSIRELFRTEFGHNEPFSLAFSGDGNYLACGGFGGLVRIFHVHSRCESATFLAPVGFFPLLGVSFSPDSRLLASAGVINKADVVIVWDIEQRKSRQIFYGHSDSVWGVAFSPDGRSLASGAIDATVRVWDLETNQELMRLQGKGESVTEVAFSPDGNRIASGSRGDHVEVWDLTTKQRINRLDGHGDVRAIAAGPELYPWRAFVRHGTDETHIASSLTGEVVAVFPIALSNIRTHPSGRMWIGSSGNHLHAIKL